MLNDAIEPVEGLVVDAMKGGVGFRNHIAPAFAQFGAEWTEELLVECETSCVDTNISVEFRISFAGGFQQ